MIRDRLTALGLTLPKASGPGGAYAPFVLSPKGTLYIAGQIPQLDGEAQFFGRLGETATVEQGQAAAQLCALNILAQVEIALNGDWRRVQQCVKLNGFIACTPDFTQQSQVMNGASDLMLSVFGEIGRHARTSVGVASLPRGVMVEVDATFEVTL
ncbi:endoribonuclease [Elstera litoralis]|uniref:Endoribonuclease n=1 Tax=Elstera litoralis TaxID=552518 RepID=A0A0F3IS62_9PROT|nr:RidA family protein [Elstera litoralis]KJV09398.1 endoribonuclease [Elstera litoralis]